VRVLHIGFRHSIIIRPVLDLLKVPTHMVTFVVGPIPFFPRLLMEGEDVDVGETYEVHAQDLYAVV
jgi:hypothetical protein